MVSKRLKQGEKGHISKYISRAQAIKRLMITLTDFRVLCVLNGVYPKVPPSFKRLHDGGTKRKVYYDTRDIAFLSHDKLIDELREKRILKNKKANARASKQTERFLNLARSESQIDATHVIRNKYPTFEDAINDLDDCLSTCASFIFLSKTRNKLFNHINLARKLMSEFMNYVIMTNALRKVFVTIKGFYFQAEICGRAVTWLMPHCNGPIQINTTVDMKLISTFALLHTTLLGFVNFKLYQSLGMVYPPKVEKRNTSKKNRSDEEFEVLVSLCHDFGTVVDKTDSDGPIDSLKEEQLRLQFGDDEAQLEKARQELIKNNRIKKLFTNMKFFINIECPKEYLVFIIRSLGGQVSFDSFLGAGSTYSEDDESITHQIVDRPQYNKRFLSRTYVQPQWIFDSLNQGMLLDVTDYLVGAKLPPHFSPFILDEDPTKVYVSEERANQIGIKSTVQSEPKSRLELQERLAKGITHDSKRPKSARELNKKKTQVDVEVNIKAPDTADSIKRKADIVNQSKSAETESLATSGMKHDEKYLYKKLKYKEKQARKLKNRILRKKLKE